MVNTKTASTDIENLRQPRAWRAWLIGLAVLVVAGGAGLFWFFGGEAPAEVDLSVTASSLSESSGDGAAAGAITGIDGRWSVDSSVGDFTVTEDTTATFAGFRVEEVLSSIGSTTAVGRTPDVSGFVEIEGSTVGSAEIVIDLTSIVSDESRREDAIQRSLGTGSNPESTFVLTEPIELGEGAASGETVSVVANGDLTINGVTNQVEVPIEARLVDGSILITGSADVVFADYDVTVPSAPVVVSVEDNGIFEFQVWLSR